MKALTLRHLIFFTAAACLCLALAGHSAAQLPRIRVPRPAPTKTQPLPAETTANKSDGNDPAPASVQTHKPAISYESFLDMRFYEDHAGFLVENLLVVFPPAGPSSATFVIMKPNGEVVASVPLQYSPLERFAAFGRFHPASGHPGTIRLNQAGDFLMGVKMGGELITTMPFSLKEEVNSDPFNPGKKYVRSGPWSDLAFFSQITDDPNAMLHFNFWLSTRELPAGMRRPKVTLHLMLNGKEVAASRSPVVPDYLDWYFYERKELIMATKPKEKWLNLADLTRQDGELVMVVKADGQTIKSYKAQITGGKLQGLSRSRLGFEPRANFISPRYVDLTDRSTSDFTMRDMFWISKSK
ncbi:MAG TPA: hypothetical protein VFZ40_02920 [Pyrinomonadaceae bacterium]